MSTGRTYPNERNRKDKYSGGQKLSIRTRKERRNKKKLKCNKSRQRKKLL